MEKEVRVTEREKGREISIYLLGLRFIGMLPPYGNEDKVSEDKKRK